MIFRSALSSLLAPSMVSIVSMVVGCAGSAPSPSTVTSTPSEAKGETIWAAKCGACHVPVEPGSRQKRDLESALQRHRKRVRLSEEQWTELVDFLAQSPQQAKNP